MKQISVGRVLVFGTAVLIFAGCGGDVAGPSGPPVVISVNGATLPTGPVGSTVIIEGQQFGGAQNAASGEVLFSDGAGGTVAAVIANVDDWTDTFIITTVPTGAATGDLIVTTSEGSSAAVTFTVTQNAPFSPSTVSWSGTSSLPVGLSGHAVAYAEILGTSATRVVYVTGGADDNNDPQSTVHYATVGGSGALSDWTATAPLPVALAFHKVVAATPANSSVSGAGFLYVLGGATDAAGQPTNTIYRGALAADGTVSAWSSVGTLPAALHSFGAAVFLGNLYVWGGAAAGNEPVATAYRAEIGAAGGLGEWQTQEALPAGRAYFGAGSFGGYLYAFGGESGTVAPRDAGLTSNTRLGDVTYAKIDLRSRDITAEGWSLSPSNLIKSVNKHTAVVAGGNVLITAGLYNGAANGSTEESYAQLNADGSTSSFGGATGSNTIFSAGGGNVFNHAAVGYMDGNGAFHVLVVGGDDVNAPGTKHAQVWYY
jgi:hypothetical protein